MHQHPKDSTCHDTHIAYRMVHYHGDDSVYDACIGPPTGIQETNSYDHYHGEQTKSNKTYQPATEKCTGAGTSVCPAWDFIVSR